MVKIADFAIFAFNFYNFFCVGLKICYICDYYKPIAKYIYKIEYEESRMGKDVFLLH